MLTYLHRFRCLDDYQNVPGLISVANLASDPILSKESQTEEVKRFFAFRS